MFLFLQTLETQTYVEQSYLPSYCLIALAFVLQVFGSDVYKIRRADTKFIQASSSTTS